jgi:hypothetical protein
MRGLDPRIHREGLIENDGLPGQARQRQMEKKAVRLGRPFSWCGLSNSMQAAEGVDQHENWKRDAKHPQQ